MPEITERVHERNDLEDQDSEELVNYGLQNGAVPVGRKMGGKQRRLLQNGLWNWWTPGCRGYRNVTWSRGGSARERSSLRRRLCVRIRNSGSGGVRCLVKLDAAGSVDHMSGGISRSMDLLVARVSQDDRGMITGVQLSELGRCNCVAACCPKGSEVEKVRSFSDP